MEAKVQPGAAALATGSKGDHSMIASHIGWINELYLFRFYAGRFPLFHHSLYDISYVFLALSVREREAYGLSV